ncbi:hypothetical protein [Arthrobacter sp. FW306-07-I]|uniref:hypothetical protein n=1 Tax=Arthrobacter sp. FW306-07-I TaxID=2879622 RepID=UPI001F382927|nr:hypothetical protein [Arthrobacter sp. FW306-07-I]UKA76448.1 hypothetical protein LFT46_05160 [Arthrobacter sp. FW306-07-I]
MTVTSVNLINKPLAKRVDSDIKELARLFEAQQAAENRRKVTAPSRLRRKGILKKLRPGA